MSNPVPTEQDEHVARLEWTSSHSRFDLVHVPELKPFHLVIVWAWDQAGRGLHFIQVLDPGLMNEVLLAHDVLASLLSAT